MSETKHTPGPWNINARASTAVIGSDDLCVAACGSASRDLSINQANANLIAAAPDMLAALKACKKELRAETPRIRFIVSRINDALAKAEVRDE